MARVLVAGGAGYVGSTICAWLKDAGHFVWVIDDLSTGHEQWMVCDGFTRAQIGDSEAVGELLSQESFDCAMHFAAKTLVSESFEKRELYFDNNVEQTKRFVDSLLEGGVPRLIFSSTCAVFGDPGEKNISEDLPKGPLSPYGETKLAVEVYLEDKCSQTPLQATVLRYFNAAGADPETRTGEDHHPETHLIPNILKAAMDGKSVQIFGNDYDTPDGTCIRDYVHVWDLAHAHERAMLRLLGSKDQSQGYENFNLGTGLGYSVQEVIQATEEVLGQKIDVVHRDRRPGDAKRLVADNRKACEQLGFRTMENALVQMIDSAWRWEKKLRGEGEDS